MVGEIYWRKPTVESFIILVLFAKRSRWIAVALPKHKRRMVACKLILPKAPLPEICLKNIYPNAKGERYGKYYLKIHTFRIWIF